VHLFHFGKIET